MPTYLSRLVEPQKFKVFNLAPHGAIQKIEPTYSPRWLKQKKIENVFVVEILIPIAWLSLDKYIQEVKFWEDSKRCTIYVGGKCRTISTRNVKILASTIYYNSYKQYKQYKYYDQESKIIKEGYDD
jgi:hypothetical protein